QELFDRLMDSAVEIMHSDFASLLVFHNERGATNGSGELRLAASRGFPPEAVAYWERVTADSNCACGIVLRTGERCDVAHLEADPRIKGRDREIYLQAGVRAVQATPLVARDGQLLGAISTHWKTPRNPQKASERDWRMLDVLAQHAADLLERMQVDKVLHDSEQRIRQIVAQLPVGVGVMDSSGHWVLTNPLMEQYVPTAIPSALPERTARWRVWDEQGNSIPPENWPGQRALRGELVTPGLEAHYRTDNGEDVWLRVSAAPLRDENGRIIGATAVALDISKIKRAEQALLENQRTLTELVERSPFGIYIVDADFRIVHVNKSSQEGAFINVRPLIGRSFDDAIRIIWPETVACQVIDQFRHTLETGAPYYSKDFLNPRADTSAVEGYEWELHQIAMPGGRKGVVCYYYDSTRLRSAEQAMREADRRKDEFLATLAHELRNPLAPIRNSLHILRLAGADASTQPQLIEMMERQVDHMVRLVDDLLEVSRITRGKIELRKETIELAAIVRSAVESANPLIESAGHQLEITLPSQPVVLSADPVRMTQALANLLSNAAKYTEAGGRIWLTAGREGDEAVISVRDNGMGIPAEMLPRVFDIFTQIDRALGRSQGGLGIGLALVKNLVQLHDGTVEARSDGQGSEFTIRLPIPAPNESTRSEVKPHFSLQRQATNGRRILIVDDNRDAADSLAMLLRTIGLQTCTAYDGPSALEAVQTYRPSAVFLDIGMPGMDGYAVAAKIRSDPEYRNITLVALTGWGQEKDKQHAQEAGFDHHLIKPAEASALQSLLSRINEPAH
ncbi:MAG: ATP-binding protein, partial [Planctomycetaceae bacterium]